MEMATKRSPQKKVKIDSGFSDLLLDIELDLGDNVLREHDENVCKPTVRKAKKFINTLASNKGKIKSFEDWR